MIIFFLIIFFIHSKNIVNYNKNYSTKQSKESITDYQWILYQELELLILLND